MQKFSLQWIKAVKRKRLPRKVVHLRQNGLPYRSVNCFIVLIFSEKLVNFKKKIEKFSFFCLKAEIDKR